MNFKDLINKIDDCLEDGKSMVIICNQKLAMLFTTYLNQYEMKSIYNALITKFVKSDKDTYQILINCKNDSYDYFVDDFANKYNMIVDEVYAIGDYRINDLLNFHANYKVFISDIQITNEDIEFIQECEEDEYEEDDECICEDCGHNHCEDCPYECGCDECTQEWEDAIDNYDEECDCSECIAIRNKDCKSNKETVVIDGCKFIIDWDAPENKKHINDDMSQEDLDRLDKLADEIKFISDIKKKMPNDMSEHAKDRMSKIAWYHNEIMNNNMCPDCLMKILVKFAKEFEIIGIDVGINAYKKYMLDCLCGNVDDED